MMVVNYESAKNVRKRLLNRLSCGIGVNGGVVLQKNK